MVILLRNQEKAHLDTPAGREGRCFEFAVELQHEIHTLDQGLVRPVDDSDDSSLAGSCDDHHVDELRGCHQYRPKACDVRPRLRDQVADPLVKLRWNEVVEVFIRGAAIDWSARVSNNTW